MKTPRRDSGRQRGRAIESAILNAAIQELANVGLDRFQVSSVAERAEVNKTSVYRRWSTKAELIDAAIERSLLSFGDSIKPTGSLKGDIAQLIESLASQFSSPTGRAFAAAAMHFNADHHVMTASSKNHVGPLKLAARIFDDAVKQDEWDPAKQPPEFIFSLIVGAVMQRVLIERQEPDESWKARLVDTVCLAVSPLSVAT